MLLPLLVSLYLIGLGIGFYVVYKLRAKYKEDNNLTNFFMRIWDYLGVILWPLVFPLFILINRTIYYIFKEVNYSLIRRDQ